MKSAFASYEKDAYPNRFRIEILAQTIFGGVPADAKTVEWWLKSNITDNDALVQSQLAEIMLERGVGRDEAVALAASEKGLSVFRRDETGLYLMGYQLKAAIKEAASVAGAVEKLPPRKWGSTNKGLKSFVAEHIIVTDEKLYLTRDGVPLTEPDGIDRGIVHTFRGSGFRANEYVENVTIAATVITDYDFSTKEWAMLWLTGQEQGIGANRSQGSGRYTVTSWEKI